MPRQQGYYSLVQYCPDPARAEVANVGVLLFSPGHHFIDVRLSTNVKHVKSVFSALNLDTGQIRMAKRSLQERIEVQKSSFQTLEDLTQFIDQRANAVVLTAPRSIAVENPETELTELFHELVEPEKEKRLREKPFPQVDAFFHRPEIRPFVEFDKNVAIPRYNKALKVPYVFTNGAIYNVLPHRFTSAAEAIRIMGEGTLLTKYGNTDGREQIFNVLPSSENADIEAEVLDVLDGLKGDNVRVIDKAGVDGFLDDLRVKAVH